MRSISSNSIRVRYTFVMDLSATRALRKCNLTKLVGDPTSLRHRTHRSCSTTTWRSRRLASRSSTTAHTTMLSHSTDRPSRDMSWSHSLRTMETSLHRLEHHISSISCEILQEAVALHILKPDQNYPIPTTCHSTPLWDSGSPRRLRSSSHTTRVR